MPTQAQWINTDIQASDELHKTMTQHVKFV